MSDTAQLRETLDRMEDRLRMSGDTGIGWSQDWSDTYDAARELLTLREAGALIITPDEDGDFPEWAVHEALQWKMGHRPDGLFNALRDAMPDGAATQTDIRPLQPGSVYTCDWGNCDEVAVVERFEHENGGWLPVCETHR